MELTSDLLKTLAQNPAHLLTAMTGIQPIIHQAMQDQGMEYSSFGKSGKGKTKEKGPSKPKGHKGKGKQADTSPQKGKPNNNRDSWQKPQTRTWNNDQAQGSSDPWWQAPDPWQQPARGGLDYSSDSATLTPCPGCMCILGTNIDCAHCSGAEGIAHLEKLHNTVRFADLHPFSQPITPGFKCPLNTGHKTRECRAGKTIFGTGDCAGCIAWTQWAARYYGPRGVDSLNPVRHALYLGYERTMLHAMVEHPDYFIDSLSHSLKQTNFRFNLPEAFLEWFTEVICPDPQDPLRVLPWPKVQTEFVMPPDKFFLKPDPCFHNLGYELLACNIQQSSFLLLTVYCAYEALPAEIISNTDLPDPNLQSELEISYDSLITLDFIPWPSVIRRTYGKALNTYNIELSWSQASIEQLAYSLLSDEDEYLTDQFADFYLQALEEDSTLEAVFLGRAPYTTEPL